MGCCCRSAARGDGILAAVVAPVSLGALAASAQEKPARLSSTVVIAGSREPVADLKIVVGEVRDQGSDRLP